MPFNTREEIPPVEKYAQQKRKALFPQDYYEAHRHLVAIHKRDITPMEVLAYLLVKENKPIVELVELVNKINKMEEPIEPKKYDFPFDEGDVIPF